MSEPTRNGATVLALRDSILQVTGSIRLSVPWTTILQIPYFALPVFPGGTVMVIELPVDAVILPEADTPNFPEISASLTEPPTFADPEKVAFTVPEVLALNVIFAFDEVPFRLLCNGPTWYKLSELRLVDVYDLRPDAVLRITASTCS